MERSSYRHGAADAFIGLPVAYITDAYYKERKTFGE